MPTQLQIRRGSTSDHTSFTGAAGELTVNTTKDTVLVHDGSTAGGFELARADGSNLNNITSNISFADNAKAQFGNGSDLQIYHDGSASRIVDSGPGDLYIQATDQLRLTNSSASESYLIANENSGVSLYFDNAPKLATTSTGIDVTGTATMDGLGVGTDSPTADLDVDGRVQVGKGLNNAINTETDLALYGNSMMSSQVSLNFGVESGGYYRFYTDVTSNTGGIAGGSEVMRLTTSGELLVGKTSDGTNNIGTQISGDGYASIVTTSTNIPLYLENKGANGNCRISFTTDSHGGASLGLNNGGDFTIFDTTAATTRFSVTDAKVVTASGGLAGIELGGVGTSNRLDDYEEGTWTPVIADDNTGGNTGTATTLDGAYTKVGRKVTVTFRATDIDTTGMNAALALRVRNLPFVSGSGIKGVAEGSARFDSVDLNDSACNITCSIGSASSVITFRQTIDSSNDSQILVGDYTSGSADFLATITYFTN